MGHSERRGLLCTWAAWAIVTLALGDLSLTGIGPPQERWAFVLPERALLLWRDTVEVEATTREAQVGESRRPVGPDSGYERGRPTWEGTGGQIQLCRPRERVQLGGHRWGGMSAGLRWKAQVGKCRYVGPDRSIRG